MTLSTPETIGTLQRALDYPRERLRAGESILLYR